MKAQKELELKFEIEPANLPVLKEIPFIHELKNPPTHANEVSVYYDTGIVPEDDRLRIAVRVGAQMVLATNPGDGDRHL